MCLEKKLVIEVDGGQHSKENGSDAKRDAWLRSQGLKVLRFWDHEVLKEIDHVKQAIWNQLNGTPSLILPRAGGEAD